MKLTASNVTQPFSEVVESSLDHFIAQCWQWDFFPSFGSLVQVENDDAIVLGCVSGVQTGSMDPMRYPFPYQKTEQELKEELPHIFEFLKTTFTVATLGYIEKSASFDKKCVYALPPKPCKIHSFVIHASVELQKIFFRDPKFLHVLFSGSIQPALVDELLLSVMRSLKAGGIWTDFFVQEFCSIFSLVTGNDYRRLKIFLQRVGQIR